MPNILNSWILVHVVCMYGGVDPTILARYGVSQGDSENTTVGRGISWKDYGVST